MTLPVASICITKIQQGMEDNCKNKEAELETKLALSLMIFLKCRLYKNTLYIWSKSYDQQTAENLRLLLITDGTEQKFPLRGFTPE